MQHEEALRRALKATTKPAAAVDFSGRWVNQMGSTMQVVISGSDLSGSYTSASSGSGGAITGPLKGNVSGDMISFLVLWPGGSMTAWVGQMINDQSSPRIKTLWHLITEIQDQDEPTKLWLSVLAGADEFHR